MNEETGLMEQVDLDAAIDRHIELLADGSKISLAGQDLAGLSFAGRDIRNIDLRRCNLTGCDFTNADCRGTNFLLAELDEADFTGADITESTFEHAKNVSVVGAVWNGVTVTTEVNPPRDPYFLLKTNAFIQIGCKQKTFADWDELNDDDRRALDPVRADIAVQWWIDNRSYLLS